MAKKKAKAAKGGKGKGAAKGGKGKGGGNSKAARSKRAWGSGEGGGTEA
jgi:hypothetical protein